MPRPTSEQFRIIYHISSSAEPPHLVPHPTYGRIPKGLEPAGREGSNDVIFGSEERDLNMFGNREYIHTYRVPESAISPELYADDDAKDENGDLPVVSRKQVNPELWQNIPASRLDALRRKQVIKFVNQGESVMSEPEGQAAEVGVRNISKPLSYIMPKPHFKELGIEYEGVERRPRLSERKLETPEVIEQRIRKSYGKDTRWKDTGR